jgi:hypothetical protein
MIVSTNLEAPFDKTEFGETKDFLATDQVDTDIIGGLPGDSGSSFGDGGTYMGVASSQFHGTLVFSKSLYVPSSTGATPTF